MSTGFDNNDAVDGPVDGPRDDGGPKEIDFLHAVVESELCVVVRWRPGEAITWASPSVRRVMGVDPSVFVGQDPDAFVSPDYIATRDMNVSKLSPEHPSYIAETPMFLPDGSRRWVRRETHGFFADGKLVALQTVGIDVSETRQALEVAQASERRLTGILEHLEDAIILVNVDGEMAWVCPSIARTFGNDFQLVATSVLSSLDSEGVRQARSAFREVVEEGPGAERLISASFKLEGEPTRQYEILQINMSDVAGVEGIVVHARDVTSRERAATSALEASVRELLTDVTEFVLHVDSEGVVRYASPSFEQHVSGSALGVPFVDALPGADRNIVSDLLQQVRSTPGRRVVGRVMIETGDRSAWVELTARQIDDHARLAGLVVVGRILDRSADSHLAVVARTTELDDAAPVTSADELVDQFLSLAPSEKLAAIARLRTIIGE